MGCYDALSFIDRGAKCNHRGRRAYIEPRSSRVVGKATPMSRSLTDHQKKAREQEVRTAMIFRGPRCRVVLTVEHTRSHESVIIPQDGFEGVFVRECHQSDAIGR